MASQIAIQLQICDSVLHEGVLCATYREIKRT